MNKTKHTTLRMRPSDYEELEREANEAGVSVSEYVRQRVAQPSCFCSGQGTIARYDGKWIYCACRAGTVVEIEHIDAKIAIFTADRDALPEEYVNLRSAKAQELERLTSERGVLIAELERLTQ